MTPTQLLTAAALALATVAAAAQTSGHQHGSMVASTAAPTPTDGEIRKIDAAKGTVLIKHGEIKNLNMGAMTMGFKFKDPKMAAGLKDGDKVKFAATMDGDQLIVTEIKKVQ